MKKGRVLWWMICMIISTVVMLAFATRTSPLYPLLLGDYGGNRASAAMVIGKYWVEGVVPYKELFAVGGPMYFLIQAVGQSVGGKTGLFVMEIISFAFFLIIMRKILLMFTTDRNAMLLSLTTVLPFIAVCSGGNSEGEWCLPWLAAGICLGMRLCKKAEWSWQCLVVAGVVSGIVTLLSWRSGAILYGMDVWLLSRIWRRKGIKDVVKTAVCLMAGMTIIMLPFFLYFLIMGSASAMMWSTFVYPMKAMAEGFDSFRVVVHKAVKCMLVAPMFAVGVWRIYKRKKDGGLLIGIAIVSLLFLLCGNNKWYYYIVAVPCIPIAVAALMEEEKVWIKRMGVCGSFLILFGICFVPLKNYVVFLIEGVPEVAEEFCGDLQTFLQQEDAGEIVMIDTDCSYYLEVDKKPACRYFSEQTELAKYNEKIAEEVEGYTEGKPEAGALVTTERGWTGQDFEHYVLTKVYLKKGGNICVYVPVS